MPEPGPEHLDDRGALGVLQHVGERGLLHVEDLAADRQQRLELGVPGVLRGAEGRVALDDEQLAPVVGRPAVDQLGRQRRGGERRLAPLVLPVLAGGDPRLGGRDDLVEHRSGLLLAAAHPALEEVAELGGDHLADDLRGRRGAEHLLGLALELRLGQPDGDDRRQALEHVLLDDRVVAGLQQPGCLELLVQRPDHRPLEAGDVRAALGGGDDVDERPQRGVVAAVPAQRDVDVELPLDLGRRQVTGVVEHRHGLGEHAAAGDPEHVGDRLAGGQVRAELADPADEPELGDLAGQAVAAPCLA